MYPLDAESILEIQRMRQAWKSEKPTAAGYYWFRGVLDSTVINSSVETVIVEVWEHLTAFVLFFDDSVYNTAHVDGEWSGPLTPPT